MARFSPPRQDTCNNKVLSKLHMKRKNKKKQSLTVFGNINSSVLVGLLASCIIYVQSEPLWNVIDWVLDSWNPGANETPLNKPYTKDHQLVYEIRRRNIQTWKDYHQGKVVYDLSGIDRRNHLCLKEFYDVYDGKWPVLLTDVVPKWAAYNWSGDFLNQLYGQDKVVMKAINHGLDEVISQVMSSFYNLPSSEKYSLSDAVSLAVPLRKFIRNTENAEPNSWTYVVDELFIPNRPALRRDIGNNMYVEEDFFQLFPEDIRPWNAMLLWGTKYSRSSLHVDPYNWTGTNAVIKGIKRWKLYPPGQDEFLYIKRNTRSGFPLDCFKYNSAVDAYDADLQKFPLFKNARSIMFDQLPGEMLFIPTGWFHQAYNTEETMALSSQVMNRNNYRILLEEIIKAGNINRNDLPTGIDNLTPKKQVSKIMSMLPPSLLERGKHITQDILNQVNAGPSKPLF